MKRPRDTVVLPTPPVDPAFLKCRCAELWAHPAVQLLLGDTLRPGGLELTARLLDAAKLPPGSLVLDVGSGTGATLEFLGRRGLRAVGLDYSQALARQASEVAPATVGDAERLPFAAGVADAVLMECVLSAVPDKVAALAEVRRVLRRRGALGLSDVTVEGQLPDPLDTVLSWAACAAGALTPDDYTALAESAGFRVEVCHRPSALAGLVAKARRRLALLQAAMRVGLVPDLDTLAGADLAAAARALSPGESDLGAVAQRVLAQVATAVDDGRLGYIALVARRT